MKGATLTCQAEGRRARVRRSALMGLDYLEVSRDQLTLTVTLLGRAPERLVPANLQVRGGERVTGIRVTGVEVEPASEDDDAILTVTVDQPGDFSTYTLAVVELDAAGRSTRKPMAGFDPRYATVDFSFKVACPSDQDCRESSVCPPPVRVEPAINYLAKDYASFRQLLLDRLALLMPGWQERHAPDIGIMLVEVLAYVGDSLSYYQDAVATEAYLSTARERISVRRHARLVDYRMHEGCNARAWVALQVEAAAGPNLTPGEVYFSTAASDGRDPVIFEPVVNKPATPLRFSAEHNEIKFYTWGDRLCCLPAGATRATLRDRWVSSGSAAAPAAVANDEPRPRALRLNIGDVLIFEEVLGPGTGNPADADPTHRWAVRLTRVTPAEDPLPDGDGQTTPVVEIAWEPADALPFPLCLSARLPAPDCRIISDISVARGNVVLVDHGRTTTPPDDCWQVGLRAQTGVCECEGGGVEMTDLPFVSRWTLQHAPLTFCEPRKAAQPASRTLGQDPRRAQPQVSLTGPPGICPQPGDPRPPQVRAGVDPTDPRWVWTPVGDLLESGGADQSFVVELDNDANAHLRFGDGVLGRLPDACTVFQASYRVGNGTVGNVGADTITACRRRGTDAAVPGVTPRNPLPACGGADAESMAEVKLFAPGAFKTTLERAITAEDYATLAERDPRVQRASAALRWTGSWYEAQVAVDPFGTEADDDLSRAVAGHLHRFRRLGHDLSVVPARYVPLDIAILVCVRPGFLRGHVEAAVLAGLSNRVLPDGRKGFFHPDNLTFGAGISLSRLVAAVQSVAGVQSVTIQKCQRLYATAGGVIDKTPLDLGVLALRPWEIAQLDNDPSFPEHGRLALTLGGGR